LTPASPPAAVQSPAVTAALFAAYGGILRRVFAWAFGPVAVSDEAAAHLRGLGERGVVVYVGRSAAVVTFLFFQHLFLRLGAPLADAVMGLGIKVWRPWGRLYAGRKLVRAPQKDDIVGAVRAGRSAMVFLRKPGSLAAQIRDHRDPFPALVAAQRQMSKPIYLVPQLLIWERRARRLRPRLWDVLFGEPDYPGLFRSLFALVWNRARAYVKFGEPIDLQKVIADFAGLDDATIARKVRGALHQHLARETRVVTGPPLKSPERLIEETLRDRGLRSTLAEIARERGRADGSVEKEADRDLREIAAKYVPTAIDFMKWLLDWVFHRIYDGLDIGEEGIARIAKTNARTPIVVCPSHKSHIDYLVLSHVFYTNGLTPPHIAAGINLSFFPLGTFFRRCGAFFIRRTFKGDRVYGSVLKAYIRKLVKDGFSQEFFIEGSRSRTGKVLLPKYGMLSMEVDAWIEGVRPDIAFFPTWIGYSKIIEGTSYANELAGGEKKAEDFGSLLRAPKVLISRYGRIYIRFGTEVSLAEMATQRGFDRENHTEEQKRTLVRALGFRIVDGINRATALTPTGLFSTALLAHDRRGLTTPELVDRMAFFLELAMQVGATLSFTLEANALDPFGTGPVGEARALLEKDKSLVIHRTGGESIFQVDDHHRVMLDFNKNTIIHFFVSDALLATSLLTSPTHDRATVEERTLALSRLFKQEFIYEAGRYSALFDKRLTRFADLGLLDLHDGQLVPTSDGAPRLRTLADLLVNFVESYIAATDALTLLLKGPIDKKEWLKLAMERAHAAFLAGRMRKFESLSKVTFENALELFEEQGVVVRAGDKGKLRALAPAFATQQAIDARVAEIKAFLVEKAE
jgi:glycerol-3-phosphate O-acyltransferase